MKKNKKLKLPSIEARALYVAHHLVSDMFTTDLDMQLVLGEEFKNVPYDELKKLLIEAAEKLGTLYTILHGVSKGSCYKVHANWRKETTKMYKQFYEPRNRKLNSREAKESPDKLRIRTSPEVIGQVQEENKTS